MTVTGARQQISQAVLTWDGVNAAPHRFGGTEYRLGTREIGHIHGDRMLDIPFPRKLRDELVASGAAQPHHLLPETGWISFYIDVPQDVQRAVDLLRRSYEVAQRQHSNRRTD
ncbi:MAG: DUF5519 family protein [Caldilineales bacterium]